MILYIATRLGDRQWGQLILVGFLSTCPINYWWAFSVSSLNRVFVHFSLSSQFSWVACLDAMLLAHMCGGLLMVSVELTLCHWVMLFVVLDDKKKMFWSIHFFLEDGVFSAFFGEHWYIASFYSLVWGAVLEIGFLQTIFSWPYFYIHSYHLSAYLHV